jgi:hypothetical protein
MLPDSARDIQYVTVDADGQPTGCDGNCFFYGLSVKHGATAGQTLIYHGSATATGSQIAAVYGAANQAVPPVTLPYPVSCPEGIYVDTVANAVVTVLYLAAP